MPTLNRLTRSTSKVGAILACLFLVAMLLPGAVLAANTVAPATGSGALGRHELAWTASGAWTTIARAAGQRHRAATLDAGTVIVHDR